MKSFFAALAAQTAKLVGGPWSFLAAVAVVVVWALSGPIFGYSDTWQLVINTGTTIVTFLMVFLIQSTQNRDATAIHLKLDEVIRSIKHAHNELIDAEHLDEDQLERLVKRYHQLREKCEQRNGHHARHGVLHHQPPQDEMVASAGHNSNESRE